MQTIEADCRFGGEISDYLSTSPKGMGHMGKKQTVGQMKGEWHSRRKEVVSACRSSESIPDMSISFAFPIPRFHTITELASDYEKSRNRDSHPAERVGGKKLSERKTQYAILKQYL